MARLTDPDSAPVYAAARGFADRALAADDSLFTPGRPIWSTGVIDDLYHRFVENPDESSDRFDEKFERQLGGSAPAVYQLAAECLYIYFLIAWNIKGKTKRDLIGKALAWSPEPASIPVDLDTALEHGLASVGIAYHTYRPFQLHYLLEFARHWKLLTASGRNTALEDPWVFRQVAYDVQVQAGHAMRESLLHLVHPETFECITSRDMKQRIATFYRSFVSDPNQNIDRQLLEIRGRLSEDFGATFQFWDEPVIAQWQPSETSRWGQFVYWARRYYDEVDFEGAEREYKYTFAEKLRAARDAVLAESDDWMELLRRAFGPPNTITFHIAHAKFLDWVQQHPETARLALLAIWDDRRSVGDRIRGFTSLFPTAVLSGVGSRLNIASFLNMATDLERNPPFKARAFRKAYDLTGYARPPKGADEADVYLHALTFLDTLDQEASARGLSMRDRLDGQSVVWCVTKWGPMKHWRAEDRNALLRYLGKPPEDDELDDDIDEEPVGDDLPASLEELATTLFMDPEYLRRVDKLLRSKGQAIFYGPPGTGKTYVARKLAEYYADGDPSAVTLVQFHPSYAYEDFVEGFRPAEVGRAAWLSPRARATPPHRRMPRPAGPRDSRPDHRRDQPRQRGQGLRRAVLPVGVPQ